MIRLDPWTGLAGLIGLLIAAAPALAGAGSDAVAAGAASTAPAPALRQRQQQLAGAGSDAVLTLDASMSAGLHLRNFRTAADLLRPSRARAPSIAGLDRLRISGSSQFSDRGLDLLMSRLPTREVTIVDLRQESHGILNGVPVVFWAERNWANLGRTRDEVFHDERDRIRRCRVGPTLHVVRPRDKTTGAPPGHLFIRPRWVSSEEELCRSRGVDYFRIPVTDLCAPLDPEVDRFVDLVRTLKPGGWLHFHCKAGRGRTTSFMAMVDMMKNARTVAFAQILERQHLLGGSNLSDVVEKEPWRARVSMDRLEFLRRFYEYCRSAGDSFVIPFSRWVLERGGTRDRRRPG